VARPLNDVADVKYFIAQASGRSNAIRSDGEDDDVCAIASLVRAWSRQHVTTINVAKPLLSCLIER
jgi:hypothetical protein